MADEKDEKNEAKKFNAGGSWQEWSRNFNFNRPNSANPTDANSKSKDFVEEIKVNSKNLVSEVERLLREGELRHLRIRYKERVLLDLPVTWAVVGVVLAPQLAAVAAIAGAVVGECTIEIIRKPTAIVKYDTPAAPKTEQNTPKSPDDLNYR